MQSRCSGNISRTIVEATLLKVSPGGQFGRRQFPELTGLTCILSGGDSGAVFTRVPEVEIGIGDAGIGASGRASEATA